MCSILCPVACCTCWEKVSRGDGFASCVRYSGAPPTYRPRRKNIMNSIFRQNVFAKNNVLQITYISPRLPQRFVLFCVFFVSPQRVYPFWNSNSKQIPFWEFKFHCRNMSRVSGTHVTVNAIKCHFLEWRATRDVS